MYELDICFSCYGGSANSTSPVQVKNITLCESQGVVKPADTVIAKYSAANKNGYIMWNVANMFGFGHAACQSYTINSEHNSTALSINWIN